MDEKWIELANREIDGMNSPHESRKLQDEAARNADLADYLDGLRSVAETFRASEEPPPPPGLKGRILEQARRAASARRGKAPLRRNGSDAAKLRRWRTAVFIGGGAAVACALLLFGVFFSGETPMDERDLYGTLLRAEGLSPDTTSRTFLTVEADRFSAEVKAAVSEGTAIIDIRFQSAEEAELRLTASRETTLRGAPVHEGKWADPTVYGERATAELPVGSARLIFIAHNRSGALDPIRLWIGSHDRVFVDEELDFR